MEMLDSERFNEVSCEWTEEKQKGFDTRTGSCDYEAGWKVILTTYGDDERFLDTWTLRDAKKEASQGRVCQTAAEIHCAYGCPHRCAYCHTTPTFHIACDLETLAGELPSLFEKYPRQKLWKFDNWTDTITLEPEYGASVLFIPLFADTTDQFLMLYTKSDNVEHLLDLPHGGQTIICWSLSGLSQSREIELGAPDMYERISAMEQCQNAGYTVRARISPIVPVRNWEQELEELIDSFLPLIRPDVITIDVMGWCQPEAVPEFMDVELLDPVYRQALEEMLESGYVTEGKHLFSHELRLPLLQHTVDLIRQKDSDQPVSICNETPQMWGDLSGLCKMQKENYACCCGPDSVPGHPLLT